MNIPAEIVAKLKTSEVLPTTEAQAQGGRLQLKQDTIFANRAGRVVEKDGGLSYFEADGLGRGVGKFAIELLPCQKLEDAIAQVRSEPNPVGLTWRAF